MSPLGSASHGIVIPAGGEGSRLGPLGSIYPKGLIPIPVPGPGFRPLMDAAITAATRQGSCVAIVAGSNLPAFQASPYAERAGVVLLSNLEPATKDAAFLHGAAVVGTKITIRMASDTWFEESVLEGALRAEGGTDCRSVPRAMRWRGCRLR